MMQYRNLMRRICQVTLQTGVNAGPGYYGTVTILFNRSLVH